MFTISRFSRKAMATTDSSSQRWDELHPTEEFRWFIFIRKSALKKKKSLFFKNTDTTSQSLRTAVKTFSRGEGILASRFPPQLFSAGQGLFSSSTTASKPQILGFQVQNRGCDLVAAKLSKHKVWLWEREGGGGGEWVGSGKIIVLEFSWVGCPHVVTTKNTHGFHSLPRPHSWTVLKSVSMASGGPTCQATIPTVGGDPCLPRRTV